MVRIYDPQYRYMGFNISGDFGPWTFYKSRRGKLVFYPAMPALNPPSPAQIIQQNKFRSAATTWRTLGPEKRNAWARAVKNLSMTITAFSLWTYYICTADQESIETIQRQSGEHLLD